MLHLLLTDTELELVPEEIASHPAVSMNAKRRGKKATRVLLDATLHHSALRDLSMAERRGRPDLVHFFLLLALESVLNQEKLLRVYVHTRNEEFITVDPSTRLPKNYPRFVGLMESLLQEGRVPRDDPLLVLERDYDLERCLEEIPPSKRVVFSHEGKPVRVVITK